VAASFDPMKMRTVRELVEDSDSSASVVGAESWRKKGDTAILARSFSRTRYFPKRCKIKSLAFLSLYNSVHF